MNSCISLYFGIYGIYSCTILGYNLLKICLLFRREKIPFIKMSLYSGIYGRR